jgi:hypothetical protein
MSAKHVTARISEDLYEAIEQLRDEECLDRSIAVAQLFDRGGDDWRIDTAIRRYRDGDVSFGWAAEVAGVSLCVFSTSSRTVCRGELHRGGSRDRPRRCP